MGKHSFAAFICSHGRPDKVKTLKTLKRCGYTGKWYIVCDDEDSRLDEYKSRFGESVLVFSKAAVDCDRGCNFTDLNGILQARNVCFDLAKAVGVSHFVELDDDYTDFQFRRREGDRMKTFRICDLNRIFSAMERFIDCDPRISAVSLCQGGDLIGGKGNSDVVKEKFYRKAMNSFVLRTDRRVEFRGLINEDVSTYVCDGMIGRLFVQTSLAMLVQDETQSKKGGMTETYKKYGTFTKAMFSVMYAPSCVRVMQMGRHARIHHRIHWPSAFPKIMHPRWRKP